MARREERAYREYVSDEQRSQAGCIGVQSGAVIPGRVLNPCCGNIPHNVVNARRPDSAISNSSFS